jgi:hypothetical protein
MIRSVSTRDVRYPLGAGHGSDAIHRDTVYSYAVTCLHDDSGLTVNDTAIQRMQGDMDFDASPLLAGTYTITEKAGELFDLVVSLAAGERTKPELLGHREYFIMHNH